MRNLLTVFVGAGTALWYAASLGSTWYFAHVVAVGLTLAAVGLALDGQARAEARGSAGGGAAERWAGDPGDGSTPTSWPPASSSASPRRAA